MTYDDDLVRRRQRFNERRQQDDDDFSRFFGFLKVVWVLGAVATLAFWSVVLWLLYLWVTK